MACEEARLEDAVEHGLDLSSNAFLLVHGWTAGPLLLEFVSKLAQTIMRRPMTLNELAKETGAHAGPLAITLRTVCILGYLKFDASTMVYSVAKSEEYEELDRFLRPTSPAAKALRSLYDAVTPPFEVPSKQAELCLRVWLDHRSAWAESKSKALALLLDGVVLAPLLTSITYFARWNEEGLDFGKDATMGRFDFSKVDMSVRPALSDIFDELGVGTMSSKGIVTMSSKGSLALQRVYSYFVPTSYAPMLRQFGKILFEEPGWGFTETGSDKSEVHVQRTLNVVGSGAQHRRSSRI